MFGQIVSGLSRLNAVTGDPACRDKVNTLVAEWEKCIAPDGYFFYSAKPNARHYIYDKLVGGLVDAHLYCGSPVALPALSRITDWAIKDLERSRKIADNSTEWYTLSENLYRAYLASGDEKYRDFAEVWECSEYWNIYLRGASIFAPRPNGQRTEFYHAYSHVNTLGGAGAAYLVKGNARYLDLLRNAYDFLDRSAVRHRRLQSRRQLLPRAAVVSRLGTTVHLRDPVRHGWFKMAKYLICCLERRQCGDWVERLALNGISAISHDADGRAFLLLRLQHARRKAADDFGWSFCWEPARKRGDPDDGFFSTTRRPVRQSVHAGHGEWHVGARRHDSATNAISDELGPSSRSRGSPARFVQLRTPGWLAGPMTAELNGRPAELLHDEKGWAAIRRKWTNGDKLVVEMPMQLSARSIAESQPYPSAISYGPVVLAASAPSTSFVRKLDLGQLDRALMPVAGESLTWRLAADPAVVFRPLYAYKQGQKYFLYLDPSAGRRLLHGKLNRRNNIRGDRNSLARLQV